jgi:hypothetical protein
LRNGCREAERLQLLVQRREVEPVLRLEDLARDRAGVLGIEVDRARLQRFEQDCGVPQAGLVRALGRLADDLAEHVGLGKPFRADGERLRACARTSQQDQQARQTAHA